MANLNEVVIPLAVDIKDNQPKLQPVAPAGVVGKTTLRWSLETTNSPNGNFATFNAQQGIAFQTLPAGITVRSYLGKDSTTWHAEIESTLDYGSPNQTVTYFVNYLYQQKSFSDDPVIVVTPEPVGSGPDTGAVRRQPRPDQLASAV